MIPFGCTSSDFNLVSTMLAVQEQAEKLRLSLGFATNVKACEWVRCNIVCDNEQNTPIDVKNYIITRTKPNLCSLQPIAEDGSHTIDCSVCS